jgi:hypothetical protein
LSYAVLQLHMVVIQEEDHQVESQKMKDSGSISTLSNRRSAPKTMEKRPETQSAMEQIDEGYKRLG